MSAIDAINILNENVYLNISTQIAYKVQLHPLHNSQSIASSKVHLMMHTNSNSIEIKNEMQIFNEIIKVKKTNYSVLAINGHSDHVSECNRIEYISPEENIVQIFHIAEMKKEQSKM